MRSQKLSKAKGKARTQQIQQGKKWIKCSGWGKRVKLVDLHNNALVSLFYLL